MTSMYVICFCLVLASQSCHVEAATAKSSAKCSSRSSDAEVLVLGAGMAGISAAKTLSDGGITNLLILEAQEQIGGRVKSTMLSSGVRVELGANWIQGIDPAQPEKHPLWRIAEKCGGVDGSFVLDSDKVHVFDSSGRNITNSSTYRDRLAQWNSNKLRLPSCAKELRARNLPDISVGQALTNQGWEAMSDLDNLIEWYGIDYGEFSTLPEAVSLKYNYPVRTYLDFGNPEHTTDYFVTDQKEGFVKVVKCLASNFLMENDYRLHLGSTVDWSSDCVCVTVRENGALQEYCAPHAILTFSLGVLKSSTIRFVPELPAAKRSAVERLLFGLYLKIFLEFEEIFWEEEVDVVSILRVDSIWGHFVQFQPLTNTTPVLFATVTGEVYSKECL